MSSAPLLKQAAELVRSGRLDDAARCLDALLTHGPASADAYQLAGLVAVRRGQTRQALALLDQALLLAPDNAELHLNRATLLRQLGRLQEAAAALLAARPVAAAAGQPAVLRRLALALRAVGWADAALACLDEALAQDADDAATGIDRARLLADLERTDAALAAVRALQPHLPTSRQADGGQAQAARLLYRLGAFDEALSGYRAVTARSPDQAAAWTGVGTTCLRLGRYPEAITALRRARALAPADDAVAFNLATALDRSGTAAPDTVVAAYRDALAARPAAAGHWSKLLSVFAQLGRLDALAAHLDAFLRARATYGFFWKEPYYGLLSALDALLQADRADDVDAILRRAIGVAAATDPLVTDWFRFLLGALHHRRGEVAPARSLLRAAAGRLPFLEHVCAPDAFHDRAAAVPAPARHSFDAALTFGTATPARPAADDAAAVVLCACDAVYLRRFGALFSQSIDAFSAPSTLIHLHIVAPDTETPSVIDAIRARLRTCRLRYSHEPLPIGLGAAEQRTFFTCARFLRLPDFLAHYRRPMVVADIDAVFLGDPAGMTAALDADRPLALLYAPTTLAYLYDAVGAGLLAALPTTPVAQTFDTIKAFLLSWLSEGRMHYFLDQVALGLGVGVVNARGTTLGIRSFERRGAEVALGGAGFVQMRLEKSAPDFDQRIGAALENLEALRRDALTTTDGLRFAFRHFAGTLAS